MADMRGHAEVIENFAAALRELRHSVGDPPFRTMSGRSGAISHTTLHEATKGNRLPSWETTVEFIKACDADPAEYRERWETANRELRSGRPTGTAAADEPGIAATVDRRTADASARPADEAPSAAPPPDEIAPVPEPGGRFRLNRLAVVTIAAAVVAVGALGLMVVLADNGSGGPAKASLSSAGCPVRAKNPAPAPAANKGDAVRFIADITLPDCTGVGAGETVAKVWRLKNVGKIHWRGYSLRRLDLPQRAHQCQTIAEVPIDDTAPGEMVDVRTNISTPTTAGLCYVRFKMVDGSGRVAFPGARPINFQVIVE